MNASDAAHSTELELVDLQHRDFAARLGDEITMTLPDGTAVPLTIAECSEVVRSAGHSSFSVVILGGHGAPPAQGAYMLSADGFGPSVVFIVPQQPPAGSPPNMVSYLAVFNRLDPEEMS